MYQTTLEPALLANSGTCEYSC